MATAKKSTGWLVWFEGNVAYEYASKEEAEAAAEKVAAERAGREVVVAMVVSKFSTRVVVDKTDVT